MTLLNLTQKQHRILQWIMAVLILYQIGVFLANGRSLFAAIVGGGTLGGLVFIPIAALLLLYWAAPSSPEDQEQQQSAER